MLWEAHCSSAAVLFMSIELDDSFCNFHPMAFLFIRNLILIMKTIPENY